mmetsp:Transcript_41130/g.46468  ORF Transcript_41130/g.46468 Transcript_41130/m.46468 type:complete len:102 (+) Transcript_41130:65-370(+)
MILTNSKKSQKNRKKKKKRALLCGAVEFETHQRIKKEARNRKRKKGTHPATCLSITIVGSTECQNSTHALSCRKKAHSVLPTTVVNTKPLFLDFDPEEDDD